MCTLLVCCPNHFRSKLDKRISSRINGSRNRLSFFPHFVALFVLLIYFIAANQKSADTNKIDIWQQSMYVCEYEIKYPTLIVITQFIHFGYVHRILRSIRKLCVQYNRFADIISEHIRAIQSLIL